MVSSGRVLRVHGLSLSLLLFAAFALSSCAVLTKSQLKMVEGLAISSDTLTRSPGMIFEGMAEVRTGRGLLYAASLRSPQAHFQEVSALAEASVRTDRTVKKAQTYVTVLNSYTRALRSISNKARWSSIGTELRGLGNKSDSIIIALNDTDWLEDEIPEGFAKVTGKYSALLSETYMKNRQAKAVRDYVTESDTLVRSCIDTLIAILKSPELDDLIANEHAGLSSDYRACLEACALNGEPYKISVDERYITLYTRMEAVTQIRSRCISALRSFATAHHKLALNLQSRSKESRKEQIQDISESIIDLNTYSLQLSKLIEKLK